MSWTDCGIKSTASENLATSCATVSDSYDHFAYSLNVDNLKIKGLDDIVKKEVEKQLNPEVAITTKNIIYTKDNAIRAKFYDKGNYKGEIDILPDIVDISIITNKGKECGVKVTFADKTVEKCIVNKGDAFSLEQGISICVTKKLIARKISSCHKGHESSLYNKIIQRGLRIFEEKRKEEEKKEQEKQRKQAQLQKTIAKKQARKARQIEKETQEVVNIIAAGIVKGFNQLNAKITKED